MNECASLFKPIQILDFLAQNFSPSFRICEDQDLIVPVFLTHQNILQIIEFFLFLFYEDNFLLDAVVDGVLIFSHLQQNRLLFAILIRQVLYINWPSCCCQSSLSIWVLHALNDMFDLIREAHRQQDICLIQNQKARLRQIYNILVYQIVQTARSSYYYIYSLLVDPNLCVHGHFSNH